MSTINSETIAGWSKIAKSIRSIDAVEFVETIHATEEYEDWSGCRSIPRAKRRHKQGIRTAMRVRRKPACYKADGKMFIRPELARALRKRLSDQIDRDLYSAFTGGRP